MAFGLLIIGIILLVSAVRDTQGNLVALAKRDFTGSNNFVYWVVALLIIGAVGYVDKLKPLSDALLVLILLALILATGKPNQPGGGLFKKFTAAIGTTNNTPNAANILSSASNLFSTLLP